MGDNTLNCDSLEGNPWAGDDKQVIAMRGVLRLAKATGHIATKSESDDKSFSVGLQHLDDHRSLNLIKLQSEISRTKTEIYMLRLEIQKKMQEKETAEITHTQILEKRISMIRQLNDHLHSITANKDILVQRLQKPFVGDYIKLDALHHRQASEIFPLVASLVNDLTVNLDNVLESKSLKFTDGKIDSLLTDLSSSIALLLSNFQGLCQSRQSMDQLYSKAEPP